MPVSARLKNGLNVALNGQNTNLQELLGLLNKGSGGFQDVIEPVLENNTDQTTAFLGYGVNVINTATSPDRAARLPFPPEKGRSVTVVNLTLIDIFLYPSQVGGSINGNVDGIAIVPPDGKAYIFTCYENPLPGAWTWTTPAIGQFQLPNRISISHTTGTQTRAFGVGVPGAQLINPPGPNWYDDIQITGTQALTFVPNQDYWATANLSPERILTTTKVYSNFIASDGLVPTIGRYVAYGNGAGMNNYTASPVDLSSGIAVPSGPLNNPVEVGDVGTLYRIEPADPIQVPPPETDGMGIGPFTNYYFTYLIVIHPGCITKVYDFDIFLEHT